LSQFLPVTGIVLDVRGAWAEELVFANGFDGVESAPADLREQFRAAEVRLCCALEAAASVLTVSKGMVDYLEGFGVDGRLAYVPCCVRSTTFSHSARMRMRAQLGLDGKLVYVYAGTVTRYQHVEDGLLAFFGLAAEQTPDTHLLCLTNDTERLRAAIASARIDPERVTLRGALQREMPDLLAAGDAGLLLRAPSRMNRFSQPTKFAEYLAAGLPVLVSRGTGVLDDMVETHGAGMAIDWFGSSLDHRRELVRQTCMRFRARGADMRVAALRLCEAEFLWSKYVSTVRQAYARAIAQ